MTQVEDQAVNLVPLPTLHNNQSLQRVGVRQMGEVGDLVGALCVVAAMLSLSK